MHKLKFGSIRRRSRRYALARPAQFSGHRQPDLGVGRGRHRLVNTLESSLFAAWQNDRLASLLAKPSRESPVAQPSSLAAALATARAALPGLEPTSIGLLARATDSAPQLVWMHGTTPLQRRLFTPVLIRCREWHVADRRAAALVPASARDRAPPALWRLRRAAAEIRVGRARPVRDVRVALRGVALVFEMALAHARGRSAVTHRRFAVLVRRWAALLRECTPALAAARARDPADCALALARVGSRCLGRLRCCVEERSPGRARARRRAAGAHGDQLRGCTASARLPRAGTGSRSRLPALLAAGCWCCH